MENLELLTTAMAYMEEHLQEKLCTEEVAEACFCSKSTLEKLFRYVNHLTVYDYIKRRRMTLAARQLWQEPDRGIIQIALDYGYTSHEAFNRAFKQVWNCKPSEFRKKHRYSELFPRFYPPVGEESEYMRERKHVDISELYDLFKSRRNCYFVYCDVASLGPINAISEKAGDLAILKTMERMEQAAGEEDIVFRIGGDEFVILTDQEDIVYAEAVAEKIRKRNGEKFSYEDREIPLALHVGVTAFTGNPLRYSELFTGLHMSIKESKN